MGVFAIMPSQDNDLLNPAMAEWWLPEKASNVPCQHSFAG